MLTENVVENIKKKKKMNFFRSLEMYSQNLETYSQTFLYQNGK